MGFTEENVFSMVGMIEEKKLWKMENYKKGFKDAQTALTVEKEGKRERGVINV